MKASLDVIIPTPPPNEIVLRLTEREAALFFQLGNWNSRVATDFAAHSDVLTSDVKGLLETLYYALSPLDFNKNINSNGHWIQ